MVCVAELTCKKLNSKLAFVALARSDVRRRFLATIGNHWQPLADTPPCQVKNYGDADSITAMADIALAATPASFVLAGHLDGGRVALEVARLAPKLVEKSY